MVCESLSARIANVKFQSIWQCGELDRVKAATDFGSPRDIEMQTGYVLLSRGVPAWEIDLVNVSVYSVDSISPLTSFGDGHRACDTSESRTLRSSYVNMPSSLLSTQDAGVLRIYSEGVKESTAFYVCHEIALSRRIRQANATAEMESKCSLALLWLFLHNLRDLCSSCFLLLLSSIGTLV